MQLIQRGEDMAEQLGDQASEVISCRSCSTNIRFVNETKYTEHH